MTAEVQFGLLGPLQVRSGGISLPVPAGKQRALLAGLLLQPGCVVSVAELVGDPMGEDSPASARARVRAGPDRRPGAIPVT